MIADSEILGWMRYRIGVQRSDLHRFKYVTKDLRSSIEGRVLVDTFGQSTIRAFCGFIDLREYSDSTCGKSPSEAAKFISPFLDRVVGKCFDCGAIVDKTIGDEIMFVLPDLSDDNGIPPTYSIGRLNAELIAVQRSLGSAYRFRIGLSFGEMELMRIASSNFEEWTVAGEAVNLAKRIQGIDELKDENREHAYCGAFGMLGNQDVYRLKFDVAAAYLAGEGSGFSIRPIIVPQKLKGISIYRCDVFFPDRG